MAEDANCHILDEKISPSGLQIAEDESNVQGWKPITYTKGLESKQMSMSDYRGERGLNRSFSPGV
jgi:hypothetical protein